MTEAGVNSTASLRRLVPRIFSKAQPSGAVDTLMRTVRMHHPKGDLGLIERAYRVADEAHTGQTRQSGEPYITHPLAVAQILADLGLGPRAIAAALLHDTVEDTDYALETLNAEFGDEVAMLVDGVTKLDKVKYGDSTHLISE
jgi:GTP diphosphokinase / guanosine-3',5'-bis(diphosphate) 3'-diphosphatase